jgi:hypothetical protein
MLMLATILITADLNLEPTPAHGTQVEAPCVPASEGILT